MGAGRFSRPAKFVTSSELFYLLNLLYNMLSECCVEYKLIQHYQKSSVWCFASSHTSTFELISSVATAQPGALVTGLYISREDYANGYALYAFDLTADLGEDDHFNLVRQGNVRLAEFENVIEVDRDRNVIFDFGV